MSCTNCGSPFHEKWACSKPPKNSPAGKGALSPQAVAYDRVVKRLPAGETKSTAKDRGDHSGADNLGAGRNAGAGSAPAAADTNSVMAKNATTQTKRGRPKTIKDMKAYKRDKAKEYRARKNGT